MVVEQAMILKFMSQKIRELPSLTEAVSITASMLRVLFASADNSSKIPLVCDSISDLESLKIVKRNVSGTRAILPLYPAGREMCPVRARMH